MRFEITIEDAAEAADLLEHLRRYRTAKLRELTEHDTVDFEDFPEEFHQRLRRAETEQGLGISWEDYKRTRPQFFRPQA